VAERANENVQGTGISRSSAADVGRWAHKEWIISVLTETILLSTSYLRYIGTMAIISKRGLGRDSTAIIHFPLNELSLHKEQSTCCMERVNELMCIYMSLGGGSGLELDREE
jgi:hypothetical protein